MQEAIDLRNSLLKDAEEEKLIGFKELLDKSNWRWKTALLVTSQTTTGNAPTLKTAEGCKAMWELVYAGKGCLPYSCFLSGVGWGTEYWAGGTPAELADILGQHGCVVSSYSYPLGESGSRKCFSISASSSSLLGVHFHYYIMELKFPLPYF